MKTKEQKLEQIKRIMKRLHKRGQNKEWINDIYRELIKKEEVGINPQTFNIVLDEDFSKNTNPLGFKCSCPCHKDPNIIHFTPCC